MTQGWLALSLRSQWYRGWPTPALKCTEGMRKRFCRPILPKELKVNKPLDQNSQTGAQKNLALQAVRVIKEKRCGRLNGRMVADWRATERAQWEIRNNIPNSGHKLTHLYCQWWSPRLRHEQNLVGPWLLFWASKLNPKYIQFCGHWEWC